MRCWIVYNETRLENAIENRFLRGSRASENNETITEVVGGRCWEQGVMLFVARRTEDVT